MLREAISMRRHDPAGCPRSAWGDAWHSAELRGRSASLALLEQLLGARASQGWFIAYGPGGGTLWHAHAGARRTFAVAVAGRGSIDIERAAGVHLEAGDLVELSPLVPHRALPALTPRTTLVMNV